MKKKILTGFFTLMMLLSVLHIASLDVQAAPSKEKMYEGYSWAVITGGNYGDELKSTKNVSARVAYNYLHYSGILKGKTSGYEYKRPISEYMNIVKSAFANPPSQNAMINYLKPMGEYNAKTGYVCINVYYGGGDAYFPNYFTTVKSSGKTHLYGYWCDTRQKSSKGTENLDYANIEKSNYKIIQHMRLTLNKSGKIESYTKISKKDAAKNILYNITYDANGGKSAPKMHTKTHDSSVKLSTKEPTRTGYTFLGWSGNKNAVQATYSPGQKISANQNVKLYAVWSRNKYKIRYDANGGKGSMQSTSGTYGNQVKLSDNKFTKNEYTFTGWNTKPNGGGTSYKNGDSICKKPEKNNTTYTLYAQWKKNIEVTLDAGKGIFANGKKTKKVSIPQIGTYGNLEAPTRKGYTFIGWYNSGGYEVTSTSAVSNKKAHTLTAKWIDIPTLELTTTQDLVRVKCTAKENVSGIDVFIDGVKYRTKKEDGKYYTYINMEDKREYQFAAQSYYKKNGKTKYSVRTSVKRCSSENVTYINLPDAESLNIKDLAIPMSAFYQSGRDANGMDPMVASDLTPQGICCTEDYILMTGYGTKKAKIVVLDKETYKPLAVLSLKKSLITLNLDPGDMDSHVGGITYDPIKRKVWVSGYDGKNVARIDIESIDKYVKSAKEKDNTFNITEGIKSFETKIGTNSKGESTYATPSFLEYKDGYLYVGTFGDDKPKKIRKFKVKKDGKGEKLDLVETWTIPNKIQGMIFTDSGELILSQSYGRMKANDSRLYVYEGDGNNLSSYKLKHIIQKLPPMSEEIMIMDDKLFIVYESSAAQYKSNAYNVQNTVWAVDVEHIIR